MTELLNTRGGIVELFIFFTVIIIIILWGSRGKHNVTPAFDDNFINNMDGYAFENYCAQLLKANGFLDVHVTQGSGDRGFDITCSKNNIKYAIQCKRHTSKIARKAIQEIYTGKAIYKCDIGVILTNSSFTESALKDAHELGVELWDKDKLKQLHASHKSENVTVKEQIINIDSEVALDSRILEESDITSSELSKIKNMSESDKIDSPKKEFFLEGKSCDKKEFESCLANASCDVKVTLFYKDGKQEQSIWKVRKFKENSSLSGNLNSGYLRNWKNKGIIGIKLEL